MEGLTRARGFVASELTHACGPYGPGQAAMHVIHPA